MASNQQTLAQLWRGNVKKATPETNFVEKALEVLSEPPLCSIGLQDEDANEKNKRKNDEPILSELEVSKNEAAYSDYEKRRLENIAENEAILEQLGLIQGAGPAKVQRKSVEKKSVSSSRKRIVAVEQPVRRSTRRKTALVNEATDAGAKELVEDIEPLLQFSDSKLVGYDVLPRFVNDRARSFECTFEKLYLENRSAHEGSTSWSDSSLKKIYAMDFHPSLALFAAGGHGGRVAVFGLSSESNEERHEDESTSEPLLSFKGSTGWISSVHFFSEQSKADLMLLTASNDSSLTLWDIGKTDETGKLAKSLCSTKDIHQSGIFSMHHLRGNPFVCTAGKDRTVCVSRVMGDGSGFRVETRFDEHDGVVKCVRMRDENILASTGNDMNVNIFDIRAQSVQVKMENVHDLVVNSVRWHPSNPNLLLTTSFAPEMRLFDMRKPTNRVMEYKSHSPMGIVRCKQIYHPCFVQNGAKILTPGDSCDYLTIYDTNTGDVVSRGSVGFQSTSLAVEPDFEVEGRLIAGSRVIAAHGPMLTSLSFSG